MYCNELIQQKLKNIKKEQEIFKNNKNFTNESYQISIKLYESFTKTYQQPLFKNVGNFCELTEYHQLLLTLRFLKKFQSYMFILQDIIFSNLSTKAYFKKVKKRMSRSSFYNFKKLLYSLKNKQEID